MADGDECCEKSAKFDELLAETVRKYPPLYDKRSKDFKDKNIKGNAWNSVAREVGLKSAKEAEKAFRNLRNRSGRDKKKIKKVKISGTGSESVSEVKKETSEMFLYLHWLDEYIQPRNTTTSLEVSVDDEEDDDSDEEGTDISTSSTSADGTEKSSVTGRQKFRKRQPKPVAVAEIDKLELKLLHSMSENLASKSQINRKDESSLFGELIASQLRQLPFQERTMAKMEVTNVLCQRLLKLNSEASHPESNSVPVSTSTASSNSDVYNMGLRSVVNPSPTPSQNMNIKNTELQPSVNCPPTPPCNLVVPDVYGNQNPPYPPGYFFDMLKRH